MVCEFGTNVIACGPPRGVYKRAKPRPCPECERDHRFVERWDGAWYGTTLHGECGDTWQDGTRGYRPFERGWREKAVARFEAMWEHAAPVEMYERYVEADCALAGNVADEDAAITEIQAAHEAILNRTFGPESGDA